MYKAIARVQTENREVNQLQSNIISSLQSIVQNQLVNGRVIKEKKLTVGSNTINHGLGQKLQGWFIVRKRSTSDIYDEQDSNKNPELTLILNSSAEVTVDIYVF
jgi:hypothetical protein